MVIRVSIPFVDAQPGLLARYTGRGIGAGGDELVMVSIWEDFNATSVHNYESIG